MAVVLAVLHPLDLLAAAASDEPSSASCPDNGDEPATKGERYDIGASLDPASKAMNPPQYPPEALEAGRQGTVVVKVRIDADGRLQGVEIVRSSHDESLDRAAIAATTRWKYNAGIAYCSAGGVRHTGGEIRIPVDFFIP